MVLRRKVFVEMTLEHGDRSYFAMQADKGLCFTIKMLRWLSFELQQIPRPM